MTFLLKGHVLERRSLSKNSHEHFSIGNEISLEIRFVEWGEDGSYHSAEPLLRKEMYLRIFTEDKPYHAWELMSAL
jgi:hypothetical protein